MMKLAHSVRGLAAIGVATLAVLAGGSHANAATLYPEPNQSPYTSSSTCNTYGRVYQGDWIWLGNSRVGYKYRYVTGWSCQGSGGRLLYLWA